MLSDLDEEKNVNSDLEVAKRIIYRLFQHYPRSLAIYLWDGKLLRIGNEEPAFTLTFRHPKVLRDLVFYRDPVRLAEAYFEGHVEVAGDFNAAMKLRYYLETLKLQVTERAALAWDVLKLNAPLPTGLTANKIASIGTQPQQNSADSIAFHYDVSNEFYRLWLDKHMVYSCAYFESPEQDLDTAQTNKLDLICRKLRLHPGETLLDIGCGWGALVYWAARHYGVHAHGITLSRQQHQYASEMIRQQGLEHQVQVEWLDYRDLPVAASYDKVVSVGMFEHVGLKNLATYFDTVHRVLKPGGVFLNHGITSDEAGWGNSISTRFINKHVFPDGELDTISNVLRRMEEADFEIVDVDGLRPHYALTLRHWVSRLDARAREAIAEVGERAYRVWRLYMTGCALQFEQGATGIYQILAVRKDGKPPALPLTRRDIYQDD